MPRLHRMPGSKTEREALADLGKPGRPVSWIDQTSGRPKARKRAYQRKTNRDGRKG